MKERDRIIIDSKGTEVKVYPHTNLPAIPVFDDTKRPETSFENVTQRIKDRIELFEEEVEIAQERAKVKVETPSPIFVINFADVHYGSVWTDYERLERDLDLIENTDGMFVGIGGNFLDNAIPGQYPDLMLSNAVNPEEALVSAKRLIDRLDRENKLLWTVKSRCHEGWVRKLTGQDLFRFLYGDTKIPVMKNGGVVELTVGEMLYKIAAFHEMKYEGTVNKDNAPRRAFDRVVDAEIAFSAHKHIAFVGGDYRYFGKDRQALTAVKSGTYKTKDEWWRAQSGQTGDPAGQGVILFPKMRLAVPILEIEAGQQIIEAFNYMNQKDIKEIGKDWKKALS